MTTDMHDAVDAVDDQRGEVEEPEGWFETMPVEDEPLPMAGFCNVCRHPIYRVGYNFRCTEGCRCLVLGCVQRAEDRR